jgi:hypothetical protein
VTVLALATLSDERKKNYDPISVEPPKVAKAVQSRVAVADVIMVNFANGNTVLSI